MTMMNESPPEYASWQVVLRRYVEEGTRNESDLALIALDLMTAAPTDPAIIRVMNNHTLRMLNRDGR